MPAPFWKAIEGGALGDGSLARFLVFLTDEHYPARQDAPEPADPPAELLAALAAIAAGAGGHDHGGNLAEAMQSGAAITPYTVPLTPAAETAMATARQHAIERLRAHQGTYATALFGRHAENAAKLAMLAAISRNPVRPVTEEHDVTWAHRLVDHCIGTLLREADRHVADRRVISGIVQVLRSGAPWPQAPTAYGPAKTLYNRLVRWAEKGVWLHIFETLAAAGGPPAAVLLDSTHAKAHRCAAGGKGGEQAQAIGRSRGGRTTKIHALSDDRGRPLAFHLTAGQAADCRAAEALLHRIPADVVVLADRAYDTDPLRRAIEAHGAAPNTPSKVNRRWKACFSAVLYRGRNAIERMFGRLKDFRRIATRYDRLAANFHAALCLAATVCYWL